MCNAVGPLCSRPFKAQQETGKQESDQEPVDVQVGPGLPVNQWPTMTAATLPVPTAAAKAKSRNAKRSARRLRAAKAALPSTARPAAKKPRKAVTVDSLSWSKTQGATDQLAFDAEGGGMDLEEVDDVQVVYGEPDEEGRRSVRFVVRSARFQAALPLLCSTSTFPASSSQADISLARRLPTLPSAPQTMEK